MGEILQALDCATLASGAVVQVPNGVLQQSAGFALTNTSVIRLWRSLPPLIRPSTRIVKDG